MSRATKAAFRECGVPAVRLFPGIAGLYKIRVVWDRDEGLRSPGHNHRCLSSYGHEVFFALAVMRPFHTDVLFECAAHRAA